MGNSLGVRRWASESINHAPERSIDAACGPGASLPAASSQQNRTLTADHIVVRVAVCRRVVGHRIDILPLIACVEAQ